MVQHMEPPSFGVKVLISHLVMSPQTWEILSQDPSKVNITFKVVKLGS